MELAFKYSYIGKTIALAVFYVPIFPLGVVIAFFGLFIMYFIEKYNVLYHYKRPERIDGQITRAYINLYRVVIFIYAISNYVFLGGIYKSETEWELIAIILFGVLILLPYGSLLKKVGFFQVSSFTDDKYEDLYFEMGMNYAMANPLTKNKGFEKYLDRLLERKMISKPEYVDHLKRIQSTPSDIIELYYKKKYGKEKKGMNLMKGLLKTAKYDQGSSLKNKKNYIKRFNTNKKINANNLFGINFEKEEKKQEYQKEHRNDTDNNNSKGGFMKKVVDKLKNFGNNNDQNNDQNNDNSNNNNNNNEHNNENNHNYNNNDQNLDNYYQNQQNNPNFRIMFDNKNNNNENVINNINNNENEKEKENNDKPYYD